MFAKHFKDTKQLHWPVTASRDKITKSYTSPLQQLVLVMGINILGTKQCTPSGWPFFVLKLYSPLHFQDYDEIWNSVSLFLPSDSFLYFYDKEYGSEREMQTRHSYIDRAFRHSHLRCWCVPEDRKAATGIDKFSKGGTLHPLLVQRKITESICYDY